MRFSFIAVCAIGGGCIGIAGAIIGLLLAGLPGEIAGVCVAILLSLMFGTWMGKR